MVKPKSDLYKLIEVVDAQNRKCKLCGVRLSKNITRVKVHFLKNCKNALAIKVPPPLSAKVKNPSSALVPVSPELEESVGINHELEELVDSLRNNSNSVVNTSTAPTAAYEPTPLNVFQYEAPNVSQYSGSSGYQNTPTVNSVRIQSAPTNGNSQHSQRLLPKGGKNRNANILSAVLCLIKELDYASLEVVDTTIHCRMEEMED